MSKPPGTQFLVPRIRAVAAGIGATRDVEHPSGLHRRSVSELARVARPAVGDDLADRLQVGREGGE